MAGIVCQDEADARTGVVFSSGFFGKEELFTRGNLKNAIQASGAVPMLFKPVDIDGSLYVDGGMVNKAPVLALADLIQPEKIIIHFITSDKLEGPLNSFLEKNMTPWHVHRLSIPSVRWQKRWASAWAR